MKPINKAIRVIIILFYFSSIYCQVQAQEAEPIQPLITFHPFIGYGKYSITQLENPDLYESLNSKGDFFGGFYLRTQSKISLSMSVGYEYANPILKGSTMSNDNFIKTQYVGAGIQYSYLQHKNWELFSGISSLLVKTQKELPIEKSTIFDTKFDFTIIGLQYNLFKHLSASIMIGAGESGFVRGSVCL